MATTVHPIMVMATPSFQNFADADTSKYFDLDQYDASTISPSSHQTFSQTSNMTSPMDPSMTMTSPVHHLLDGEEMQTPAKPSHEYGLFKQQTGLPPGSITGLMQQQSGFSDAGPFQSQPLFSSTGLGEPGMLMDTTMFDPTPSWNTGLNEGSVFDMFDTLPSNDFVDPSTITQEPVVPFKVFPGMHQQAAAAKAEQQRQMLLSQQRQRQRQQQQEQQQQPLHQSPQQQHQPQQQQQQHQSQEQQQQPQQQHQQQQQLPQQQQKVAALRSQQQQMTDANTESAITRILAKVREESRNSAQSRVDDHQSHVQQLARLKKEEEDMDEDEKLLASEEGKKLSSKERRQLRNKVSARAFRSRRKDYIQSLEQEVAHKSAEAHTLRTENEVLREENMRFQNLVNSMLRSPQFRPYVETMSMSMS